MSSLARHGLARRQIAEVMVVHLQGLSHVDVTGDGQASVGRGIEPHEEVLDVVQVCGVQVFLGADGHPMIGVGHWIQGFLQMPMCHAIGAILIGLATFVLDHVPLDIKALLVQCIEQKSHAVGFQPKG